MRWVENFGMMEKVRQFMFERCKIPKDAVKNKGNRKLRVLPEEKVNNKKCFSV